uniref:Uncharacterized protein n=1 Tax=Anguilla anguilla TaxID=7936 RepID=A0A0E9XR35_ANGAN
MSVNKTKLAVQVIVFWKVSFFYLPVDHEKKHRWVARSHICVVLKIKIKSYCEPTNNICIKSFTNALLLVAS